MTNLYFVAVILLGLLGIVGLGISAYKNERKPKEKKQRRPNLSDATLIFLSSSGIVGGVRVCVFSLGAFEGEELFLKLYIFVGGLAVIWVSASTIFNVLFNRSPPTN